MKNLTEIVMVLDESGSMEEVKDDTIGGFNNFVDEQKDQPGESKLTLVKFDRNYKLMYTSKDIKKVEKLDNRSYSPGSTTALLDAVGRAIKEVSNNIQERKREDKPEKLLFVIITDGYENSSTEYKHSGIKKLIEEKENDGWKFSFLGADVDDFADAHGIGVNQFVGVNKKDMSGTFSTLSAYTSDARAASNINDVNFTDYFNGTNEQKDKDKEKTK